MSVSNIVSVSDSVSVNLLSVSQGSVQLFRGIPPFLWLTRSLSEGASRIPSPRDLDKFTPHQPYTPWGIVVIIL